MLLLHQGISNQTACAVTAADAVKAYSSAIECFRNAASPLIYGLASAILLRQQAYGAWFPFSEQSLSPFQPRQYCGSIATFDDSIIHSGLSLIGVFNRNVHIGIIILLSRLILESLAEQR